jgi:hypothetical protein
MPDAPTCECLHDRGHHPDAGPCRLVHCGCPGFVAAWCGCCAQPMGAVLAVRALSLLPAQVR